MKIVVIEWLDSGLASGANGWVNLADLAERSKLEYVKSVGFLYLEDDDNYILVNTVDEAHETGLNMLVIAKLCVRKVTTAELA